MKILCVNIRKGMGDQIIFLPYLHSIAKKYNTPVHLLAKEESRAKDLFAEDHNIEKIITLEKNMDGISGISKLVNEFKKNNYEKIFIFNSSLRYNIVARLAGIKSINQYPLFLKKDNIVHSAKIFTQTVTGGIVDTEPHLIIKNKKKDKDRSFKHVCLGISASGPTKRWNIENYIKLAKKINTITKCKFYLAGGKNDIELINKFKDAVGTENSISFDEMKIKETLKYISDCDLYIGNDTGWAHISVALNIKAITIFCDSPVAAYGYYSKKMITVEPEGIPKGTTTHDTLGKDKVSFENVYNESIRILC